MEAGPSSGRVFWIREKPREHHGLPSLLVIAINSRCVTLARQIFHDVHLIPYKRFACLVMSISKFLDENQRKQIICPSAARNCNFATIRWRSWYKRGRVQREKITDKAPLYCALIQPIKNDFFFAFKFFFIQLCYSDSCNYPDNEKHFVQFLWSIKSQFSFEC